LAKRISILPKRAERILKQFISKQSNVVEMVNNSFLRENVKADYLKNFSEKLLRIGGSGVAV